jgi:hypothetical protein
MMGCVRIEDYSFTLYNNIATAVSNYSNLLAKANIEKDDQLIIIMFKVQADRASTEITVICTPFDKECRNISLSCGYQ